MDRLSIVQQVLWDLDMPPSYLGAHYLACAAVLAMEDWSRLTMVTKWLYPEVAERYHTTWKAVERDIRTAIRVCWARGGAAGLEKLCGRPLCAQPSPTGMIQLLCRYLLDQPEEFWRPAGQKAQPPARSRGEALGAYQ